MYVSDVLIEIGTQDYGDIIYITLFTSSFQKAIFLAPENILLCH